MENIEKGRENIGDSVEVFDAETTEKISGKEKSEGSLAGEQKETSEFDLSTEKGLSGLLVNAALEVQTEAFRNYIISNPESLGEDRTEIEKMSGLQICRIMKRNPELLHKALEQDPICAKIIDIARAIEEEKRELNCDDKSMFLRILKKIEKLEREARTDFLTDLLNKRGFRERLEIEAERFERHKRPFLIVYLDMDYLKKINDEQGHHKGDEALISLAKTIKEKCRLVDHAARIGGDEFVILFTETDNEEIISRLRSEVLNVSLGYCCYDGTVTAEEAIRIAETAMREDKKKREKGR